MNVSVYQECSVLIELPVMHVVSGLIDIDCVGPGLRAGEPFIESRFNHWTCHVNESDSSTIWSRLNSDVAFTTTECFINLKGD